jgi:hypothetical protein
LRERRHSTCAALGPSCRTSAEDHGPRDQFTQCVVGPSACRAQFPHRERPLSTAGPHASTTGSKAPDQSQVATCHLPEMRKLRRRTPGPAGLSEQIAPAAVSAVALPAPPPPWTPPLRRRAATILASSASPAPLPLPPTPPRCRRTTATSAVAAAASAGLLPRCRHRLRRLVAAPPPLPSRPPPPPSPPQLRCPRYRPLLTATTTALLLTSHCRRHAATVVPP